MTTEEKTNIKEITEKRYKNYHNKSLARLLKFSGYDKVEVSAKGLYVQDSDGKKYLDCAGGYGVFVAGHNHPYIIEKVSSQLHKMPLSSKVFLNPVLAELCEKLADIAPEGLKNSFICNSGAEAVEGAIKTARLATGKIEIISTINAFHGKTFGALSASGRELYKTPFEPLMKHFKHIAFGNAKSLEQAITKDTAAFIVEPVQGEGGIITPPDGYFEQVQEICKKAGVLLIIDEIQTGFGRTGKMFACEHWSVKPDLMTIAKALGGGVMPIGAFMGTEKVWECFKNNPVLHTSTFGGNQLACSAAIATLEVIEKENLVQNALLQGKYLLTRLHELKEKYPEIIREVRGMGLLAGVCMHKQGYSGSVIFEMIKDGIIAVYTLNNPEVIRLEPPLIISKKEIDIAISAFERALQKTKQNFIK